MDDNTLLSLLTGGRYTTSEDLPTIPEMAHSYIDQVKDAHDAQMKRDVELHGTGGLGLLDMVGGFSKAGALIPAMTKKYTKSPSGQSQLADLIEKISTDTKFNKSDLETLKMAISDIKSAKSSGSYGKRRVIKRIGKKAERIPVDLKNPYKYTTGEKLDKLLDTYTSESMSKSSSNMINQAVEKALEQYKQFGAARPGTEDFIQTLIRELKK